MAKRASNDGGIDRMSELPDEIRCRILSMLPTDVAVRTSILSTRWRHLFASLSNFHIDFRINHERRVDSFPNFMLKSLYFHTGILEHFRFKPVVGTHLDFERVYDWISAALHRGVRELDLDFSSYNLNSCSNTGYMPPEMFNCQTLVTLKLNVLYSEPYYSLTVPVNVSVPCLKTLELRGIQFEVIDSVERPFSSCPVLEDLSISDCYSDCSNLRFNISNPTLKRLTIEYSLGFDYELLVLNVPSLVYLKYTGYMAKQYSIAEMHSLVKADIYIFPCEYYAELEDYQKVALSQLLQAMDHVKLFYLNIDYQVVSYLQFLISLLINLMNSQGHCLRAWS